MDNHFLVLKKLMEYNQDELFYRDYYFAKQSGSRKALQQFLQKQDLQDVKRRKLLCPELYDIPAEIIDECNYIQMDAANNIYIEKHNRYSPDFEHSHAYFESFYVLSGQCTHTIDGVETNLPEGTFCMIAPFKKHRVAVFDDSIVLNIMIQRTTFDDMFFNLLRSQNVLSCFFLSNIYPASKNSFSHIRFAVNDEELEQLILSMLLEQTVRDDYTNRILNNLIGVFFTKLVRKYGKTALCYPRDIHKELPNFEVVTYINKNYKDVTLAGVAEHFHYSEEHCSRLIKATTGTTFTILLRSIRMRRAETLLLTTGLPANDISYLVGYENPGTFIRLFKREYGMTPAVFRKLHYSGN
ncbi:MAG: AraC family transcriptional regulator [Eubacteriales bacterium]|nr:AraC family transcriptional regulator [Eubacteriales bacterium]